MCKSIIQGVREVGENLRNVCNRCGIFMDPSQRTWTPNMRRNTKARIVMVITTIRIMVVDKPGFFKTLCITTSSAFSSNVHSNGPNVFMTCIRFDKTSRAKRSDPIRARTLHQVVTRWTRGTRRTSDARNDK